MTAPDGPVGRTARLGGLLRLVHPFPSLLDGVVTVGVALVAGADAADALRLGAAMTSLQFSIGALNDLADQEQDAGLRTTKPIPAGLVTRPVAWLVVAATLAAGLLLTLPSGRLTTAVAMAGVGVGYAYDLRLKGTAWSWVGLAAGLPLLPVFAWVGASGALPGPVIIVAVLAGIAGAALALANALADLERDVARGTASVATRLGRVRAGRLVVLLQGVVVTIALGSIALVGKAGAGDGSGVPTGLLVVAILGALTVIVGVRLSLRPRWRVEIGWEIQGVGLGLLAVGWLWALASAGAFE